MRLTHHIAALAIVSLAVASCAQVGSPNHVAIGQSFILENGDGDPEWLHQRHRVEYVDRDWFSGEVEGRPGGVLLFRVTGWPHRGEFVALSSRWRSSIEEQMQENGAASVVVHRFLCESSVLERGEPCETRAIGMTVLRHADDRRFAP